MATFADMMTLLFAFFVLLFSMATIDRVKVSAMQDAMIETVTTTDTDTQEKKQERILSINRVRKVINKHFPNFSLEPY